MINHVAETTFARVLLGITSLNPLTVDCALGVDGTGVAAPGTLAELTPDPHNANRGTARGSR